MKFTALPIPFGVWSVESKDKGVIELKKNYGCYADSLSTEFYRPRGVIRGQKLSKMLQDGMAIRIPLKVPSRDCSTLSGICLHVISQNLAAFPGVDKLPKHLHEEILSRSADVRPIPIEYCVRRVAIAEGVGRMQNETRSIKLFDKDWCGKTWSLLPETPSYTAIWHASAKVDAESRTILAQKPQPTPPPLPIFAAAAVSASRTLVRPQPLAPGAAPAGPAGVSLVQGGAAAGEPRARPRRRRRRRAWG